jgi:hypothetical protein
MHCRNNPNMQKQLKRIYPSDARSGRRDWSHYRWPSVNMKLWRLLLNINWLSNAFNIMLTYKWCLEGQAANKFEFFLYFIWVFSHIPGLVLHRSQYKVIIWPHPQAVIDERKPNDAIALLASLLLSPALPDF